MTKPRDDQDDLDAQILRKRHPAYEAVSRSLAGLADVEVLPIPIAYAFSVAFIQLFLADQPNYELARGVYGASRSNWTYHTALAIAQASKLMNLTCKFETQGKRDALIETRDERPEVVLVAEWEWEAEDVFGKGKELEKLRATCRGCDGASAFLLTYCTEARYPEYLRQVTDYWINTPRRQRNAPMLLLHTILYRPQGTLREFDRLRTADIDAEGVRLWEDQPFD